MHYNRFKKNVDIHEFNIRIYVHTSSIAFGDGKTPEANTAQ
jgi:hypothetical protein